MHSTFSDGKLTIPQIVDFFGSRGVGAIAITDHLCETNTLWGKGAHLLGRTLTRGTFPIYQAILRSEAKRAWQQYRMVVIPGFEVTKNAISDRDSAHILALGVTEWISADDDVVAILEQIRRHGGLSVAAHPRPFPKLDKQTLYLWENRQRLMPHLDCWEVANGKAFFDDVAAQSLPKLAASDFHHPRDFESWKSILRCSRERQEILASVLAGEVSFDYVREVTHEVVPAFLRPSALGQFGFAPGAGNLACVEAS